MQKIFESLQKTRYKLLVACMFPLWLWFWRGEKEQKTKKIKEADPVEMARLVAMREASDILKYAPYGVLQLIIGYSNVIRSFPSIHTVLEDFGDLAYDDSNRAPRLLARMMKEHKHLSDAMDYDHIHTIMISELTVVNQVYRERLSKQFYLLSNVDRWNYSCVLKWVMARWFCCVHVKTELPDWYLSCLEISEGSASIEALIQNTLDELLHLASPKIIRDLNNIDEIVAQTADLIDTASDIGA